MTLILEERVYPHFLQKLCICMWVHIRKIREKNIILTAMKFCNEFLKWEKGKNASCRVTNYIKLYKPHINSKVFLILPYYLSVWHHFLHISDNSHWIPFLFHTEVYYEDINTFYVHLVYPNIFMIKWRSSNVL